MQEIWWDYWKKKKNYDSLFADYTVLLAPTKSSLKNLLK
jgi:hypothetical protein